MRRLSVFFICAIICSNVCAQDFVPFVIPAEANPDSLIAMSSPPIAASAERVVAKDGHFFLGDESIRFWGVNLSFGANFPTHDDAPVVAREAGRTRGVLEEHSQVVLGKDQGVKTEAAVADGVDTDVHGPIDDQVIRLADVGRDRRARQKHRRTRDEDYGPKGYS